MYSDHIIEPENRIELAYKEKREHFVTSNVLNQGYPDQVIKVSIPRQSSDTAMFQFLTFNLDSQFLTFNLDLESSKDKARMLYQMLGET